MLQIEPKRGHPPFGTARRKVEVAFFFNFLCSRVDAVVERSHGRHGIRHYSEIGGLLLGENAAGSPVVSQRFGVTMFYAKQDPVSQAPFVGRNAPPLNPRIGMIVEQVLPFDDRAREFSGEGRIASADGPRSKLQGWTGRQRI